MPASDRPHLPSATAEGLADEVLPGDLHVVSSPVPLRLVVVVSVFGSWCSGMLAGTDTALATDVDAVLTPAEAGSDYRVCVHTRFSGPIWVAQLGRRVGAVESETLSALELLSYVDSPRVALRTGAPLVGGACDPRYPALVALSAEMDELTAACRAAPR